jgi:hypothetical protein
MYQFLHYHAVGEAEDYQIKVKRDALLILAGKVTNSNQ